MFPLHSYFTKHREWGTWDKTGIQCAKFECGILQRSNDKIISRTKGRREKWTLCWTFQFHTLDISDVSEWIRTFGGAVLCNAKLSTTSLTLSMRCYWNSLLFPQASWQPAISPDIAKYLLGARLPPIDRLKERRPIYTSKRCSLFTFYLYRPTVEKNYETEKYQQLDSWHLGVMIMIYVHIY